jgi:hypothetical protein
MQRISEYADSCPRCGYILASGEASEIKEKEGEAIDKAIRVIGYGCGCLIIIFLPYFWLCAHHNHRSF